MLPEQPYRAARDLRNYDAAVQTVEREFSDRPALVMTACDWCNAKGEFERSLKMLQKIDQIEPSGSTCVLISELDRKLGHPDQALAMLTRAVRVGDSTEPEIAYQLAAVDLIEDHRYSEALASVQMSGDTPTSRTWQLMARCYDDMGQFDSADECFRQQVTADSSYIAEYYLWAIRLNRPDLATIRNKAHLALTQQIAPACEFYIDMADDQESKALRVLRTDFDSGMDDGFHLAQLVILGRKLHDNVAEESGINGMPNAQTHAPFGYAFKALVQSKDLAKGIAGFDLWINQQLDDENAVDWYSLAGRYLLAAGHRNEGRAYLIRCLSQPAHDRCNFYLAWRELVKMGDDPQTLLRSPGTQE